LTNLIKAGKKERGYFEEQNISDINDRLAYVVFHPKLY
jgi:hypothetical protein